jgi:SpoVK/Ycf46/Vps4 family AAA+-type ATPase
LSHDPNQARWTEQEGTYRIDFDRVTVDEMKPGLYEPAVRQDVGLFFSPIELRDDELIRFPDTDMDKIVGDIEKFWEREQIFIDHDLPYKRGILLHGPPGSGKSCTLQLVSRDVIRRGGVVLLFTDPEMFVAAYRIFRRVQPDTPMVVLMEDVDTILERKNESKVLNLLDGAEVAGKVVFLATTNYPEKLGPRIMNRPSRFDRVYIIGHPKEESRRLYLTAMMLEQDYEVIDVDQWVRDTHGLSLAHLKELFIGVVALGEDYHETLAILKDMKRRRVSAEDEEEFNPIERGRYA